jgi:hypothetical protein
LKVVTFYADVDLPEKVKHKSLNFDWWNAIAQMVSTLPYPFSIISDHNTAAKLPVHRFSNAKEHGLMLWLLDAQAEAIRISDEDILMVSPDTLFNGVPHAMIGDWDLCLLTRKSPKPIVNSVIYAKQNAYCFFRKISLQARLLTDDSKEWGADIDAIVNALNIQPNEDCIREFDGIKVRLLPIDGVFKSVDCWNPAVRLQEPVLDFKGQRKSRMTEYFNLL